MNIWIYDENSYPSGFAGGHVPELMPESYNQGQGLALKKVELLPEKLDNCFICLKKEGDKWKDITNEIDSYKQKKGEYYLYEKNILWTFGLVWWIFLCRCHGKRRNREVHRRNDARL